MKKSVALMTSVIMLLMICSFSGCIATDDYFEYTYLESEDCYEVSGTTDKAKNTVGWNVRIPDEVMGKRVISIGKRAFYQLAGVRTIQLGVNVRSIAEEAFACCENLKAIYFNKNLRTIGDFAFAYCCSLGGLSLQGGMDSLNFPVSLSRIGKSAFWFTSIKEIVFNVSDVIIGEEAFARCCYLTRMEVNLGQKSFGQGAFMYTALSEVLFPLDWTETEAKENIHAGKYNSEYENAVKYYFSRQEPEKDEEGNYVGNYWHYGDRGEIALWGVN